MPRSRSAPAPRSLADDLRARSDAALVALLVARPDLAQPVPSDTTSLAARASTRASVQRALDQLDTPTLQVLEVMAALAPPTSRTALAAACGGKVGSQVDLAYERALVWGADRALRLVRTVLDVLGPHPAGLGPPLVELATGLSPSRVAGWCEDLGLPGSGDPLSDAESVSALLGDPEQLRELLEESPDGASRLLERLTWDGPVGSVGNAERSVRAEDGQSSVDWLLARAILVPVDAGRVVVPREVGLGLRGGRVLREFRPKPPALLGRHDVPSRRVDNAATGAATECLRHVHELAELWGRSPATVLRSGGLGVRELHRAATALDVDDSTAARVIEMAYVSGLIAQDGEMAPGWMPTPAYDVWWACDPARQWAAVASAWCHTSRVSGLVGTLDSRDAARAALSETVERPSVITVRSAVLDVLAAVPDGTALSFESLVAQLRWLQPRGPAAIYEHLVQAVLDDAAWLGVTALGALSAPGRALLQPDDDPAQALARLLPVPVEEVLLQADLTAVAPGPLASDVARELALMADVDSRGGATVYRFGAGSIRRALDAGQTAVELLAFLRKHSRTPVPQPLEYLVTDVARRHGRVRVGEASAYLRSDDDSVLDEVMADRRSGVLRLRRLAPTVLAAQADPSTVLQTLRQMGLAPAAEASDGTLVLQRPDVRRTPARERPRPVRSLPAVGTPLAEAVVRGIRSGDHAESSRSSSGPPEAPAPRAMEPSMSLAELRAAAADRRRVWIGVSDPGGAVARRLVEPLGVAAGRITVFDHGVGEVRTISIHRVTGVAPHDEGQPADESRR